MEDCNVAINHFIASFLRCHITAKKDSGHEFGAIPRRNRKLNCTSLLTTLKLREQTLNDRTLN
jgi:hypothetical protein